MLGPERGSEETLALGGLKSSNHSVTVKTLESKLQNKDLNTREGKNDSGGEGGENLVEEVEVNRELR